MYCKDCPLWDKQLHDERIGRCSKITGEGITTEEFYCDERTPVDDLDRDPDDNGTLP